MAKETTQIKYNGVIYGSMVDLCAKKTNLTYAAFASRIHRKIKQGASKNHAITCAIKGTMHEHTKTHAICTMCLETKLLKEFGRHNKSLTGRKQKCKPCVKTIKTLAKNKPIRPAIKWPQILASRPFGTLAP